MERGYFKVWRKIEDSQSYNRSALHRALLLTIFVKANWKEGYFCGHKISPGQIATSVVHLAEELSTPRTNVLRALRDIEKDGVIKTENVGNRWTLITLVKWDCYQPVQEKVGQPADNERTAGGQQADVQRSSGGRPADTIKEGKNLINTTNVVLSESELPDLPPPPEKPEDTNPVFDLEADDSSEGDTPAKDGIPPCPQKAVIEVYHEVLPELARVRVWRTNNATALRTRWREKAKEGQFRDQAGGIAYFRRFFSYVRQSDWLMARRPGRDGRPFTGCNLAWMVQAKHFDDIIACKYHDREEVPA